MDSRVIQLTPAAKKYGNLNICPCGRDFFPSDVFGGPSKKAGLGVPITLKVDGLPNPIQTDIPKDTTGKPRWIFRKRKWVKDFVRCHKLHASDTVTIERVANRTYKVSPNNNRPQVTKKEHPTKETKINKKLTLLGLHGGKLLRTNTHLSYKGKKSKKHIPASRPSFSFKEVSSLDQSFLNKIICGDCEEVLTKFPDNCIDLILTSPPYVDRRKHTYGGIHPDKYVEWFLPRSEQFLRVLKPTGTFVLNIKEKVINGERHTYVLELILGMRKQGWLWTEEFVWHKKNCYPGKWPNRFRDAWERCLQFNKNKKFNMYQKAVMVKMGDWAKSRLRNLSDTDKRRDESKVKSGFGKNISNWIGRDKAYPTNVLHLATECSNKNHSAAFPLSLPCWFIKLFSKTNDVILDPFLGSGTTAVASKQLERIYVGIDINSEYCKLAKKWLQKI